MPKGWLWDRGECDSERRAKPQRHVVSSACLLSICVVVVSDISLTELGKLKIIAQPIKG